VPLPKFALAGLALAALLVVERAPALFEEATEYTPEGTVSIPGLHIRLDGTGLAIVGHVSSVAHETILRDAVSKFDAATTVTFNLQEADMLPPGWGLVTELALRASLVTRFSATSVIPARVSIRGVTTNGEAWNAALARLENALLPGMRLDANVTRLESSASFESLCREQFDAALGGRSLEFAVGSSALGTAEHALLDSLLEIASDCPGWTVGIRANGDGPASVTANRRLAEARVQSLVDYFTSRGMPAGRIESLPLAGDAGNRARQIVFRMRIGEGAGGAVAADTPAP
jgi:hypothetical protein